eukprot:TRINITY_DN5045_c0_g1_i2.p1 TRINITY_DN5045_c0_g1~~TRINITY_DN5045_c0_g1_i2.p1  ORF type:complete len:1168 (+),score=282.69 TRINITY_DN5045_c0_g1_i2:57-3560(+)
MAKRKGNAQESKASAKRAAKSKKQQVEEEVEEEFDVQDFAEIENAVGDDYEQDQVEDEQVQDEEEEEEEEGDDDDEDDDDDDDEDQDEFDDEGEGEEEEENEAKDAAKQSISSGAQKGRGKKGYVPPTADEMIALRQTEELFASNLIRLQIHELLGEVSVNYQHLSKGEALLHQLKQELSNATEELIQGNAIEDLQHFHFVNPEKKLIMHFQAPTSFCVIGSYLLRTMAKPHLSIDVSFTIPEISFSKKDVQDYKYFERRVIYLGQICHIIKKKLGWPVKWSTFRGDSRKPILVVKPPQTGKDDQKVSINIIPSIPKMEHFITKLHPKKGNLRSTSSEQARSAPTPYYNNSILEDMFYQDHLTFCHERMKNTPSYVDAVVLFKVWLKQREMTTASDAVNGFLMTMIMLHLHEKKMVNEQMSSYQIFRVVMEFIAHLNIGEGIFMKLQDGGELDEEVKRTFLESFDVVFTDQSGVLNLASHISKSAFSDLQAEAMNTQNYFKNTASDPFEAIFLTPVHCYLKFDMFLRVELDHFDSFSDDEYASQQGRTIAKVLENGLKDRLISLRLMPMEQRKISTLKTDNLRRPYLVFGLQLNPQTYQRIIDMGPAADSPDAAAFRKFWGPKAELRRFKDGSILECVVWEGASTEQYQIIMRIIQHILVLHANVTATSLRFTAGQLQFALKMDGETSDPSRTIITTFDKLTNLIKELPNLPLKIRNINASSPAMRYTDPSPPTAVSTLIGLEPAVSNLPGCEYPALISPLKGVIIFEGSGKWPDELAAVRAMISAFYIQLHDSLKQAGIYSMISRNFIDVVFEGYCFRLHIYLDREAKLLGQENSEYPALARREDLIEPNLNAALHAFQALHPNYPATVRLAKKWVHAQLYSSFVTEEAIELIVAYIFSFPQPYSVPNTPLAGFHRFLWFLSCHDFDNNVLYIPFDEEDAAASARKAQKVFESTKNGLKSSAIYIATKFNKNNFVLWTKNQPTKQVFFKLVEAARDACKVIHTSISDAAFMKNYKIFFEPRMESFDLAIMIDSKKLASGKKHVTEKKFKNVGKSQKGRSLLIGFDPLEHFVDELRIRFQDIALVFYNKLGSERVCIAWKPSAFLPRAFKPTAATFTLPLSNPTEGSEIILDIFQLIAEIRNLGQGLISEIKFAGGDHILSKVFDQD